MKNTFVLAIGGGIVATIVLTIITKLLTAAGLPAPNPPQMLAAIMGTTAVIGWILHFLIGIIFAVLYAYLFLPFLQRMDSPVLRGAVFGVAAFIIAQLAMAFIGTVARDMPNPGNTLVMKLISLVGHMVFGIVLAFMIKKPVKE